MPSQHTILLIDDNRADPDVLRRMLYLDGRFAAVEVADLAAAEKQLDIANVHFDAVIVDAGAASGHGFEVCRLLRTRGLRVPIVILAASRDEIDVLRGLEAGAIDYIVQPCQPLELAARINAHIRSFAQSEHAIIRLGSFVFWPSKRELCHSKSRRKIRLTTKETKLLRALYEAEGLPVRREDLLRDVFGYGPSIYTHTLETHIYRLRRRIEAESDELKIMLSGQCGYRLHIAPISPNRMPGESAQSLAG